MNKKRQRQEIGSENGFEEWGGYMEAKKNKLQDQFKNQAKKEGHENVSKIFKDVSVFVNGYTVPSADEIKRIMMEHGGAYHHYHRPGCTTHVIASNLPDVKIKRLKSLHIQVVKPEWITACLNAGHIVDYEPFILYSHLSTMQPSIVKFANGGSGALDISNHSPPPPPQHCNVTKPLINEDQDLFEDESEHFQTTTISSDSRLAINIPSNKTRCASDPNFLSDFYGNSRLHHISTMGAMFKQYVKELRCKSKNDFPGCKHLMKWKRNLLSGKEQLLEGDEDFVVSNTPSCPVNSNKVIMHIDMDCFFVSVGLRKYPHLKGKPVAVTHSKGLGPQVPQSRKGADRKVEFNFYKKKLKEKLSKNARNKKGPAEISDDESRFEWMENIDESDSMAEIASCSYEARSKGVRNGMFVGSALKLCPNLLSIPYDFEGYKEVALTLYNTVASYTLDIEAVSCDEMFVDCTSLLTETNCSPEEFAACLRAEIREKTQCPASTGFGANRLLARLATQKAKPDGVYHLQTELVDEFMKAVKVNDLPGVGRATASRLKTMDVITCGDLQKLSLTKLQELGIKTGEALFHHCRGRDDRPLNFLHERKSVSAEVNYGIRFENMKEAESFFEKLASEVSGRLKELNMKGRCITLKLMIRAAEAPNETAKFMGHGVCDNVTRSSTLLNPVCDSKSISREALSMLKKLKTNVCDLRGVGIQVTRFEDISNNKKSGSLNQFLVKEPSLVDSRDLVQENCVKSVCFTDNNFSHATNTMSLSINSQKTKNSKCAPSSIDKFMVSRKKPTRRDNISKLPAPSDLDLAVFSALPKNIRNEILEEYSRRTDININKLPKKVSEKVNPESMDVSLSQVDPSFLEALPTQMRHEVELDLHNKKKLKSMKTTSRVEEQSDSEKNHLNVEVCFRSKSILSTYMSAREVKDMLHEWVLKERTPLPCDVHMLKHYFHDLVTSKCIDDLYCIIRGFYRFVSKQTELTWAEEYRNIILHVQAVMKTVYNSHLQVEESIASCSTN